MHGPYFRAWKLGPYKLTAAILMAGLTVLGASHFKVQAPARAVPAPLQGYKIMVDPGHGGIDPGCHRGQTFEKEIALQIAIPLAARLGELGADVAVTRDRDTELSHLTDAERTRHRRDLSARVLLAEEHGADLLVSLHVNSASSSSLGGAMIFYHPGSSEGKRIAESILKEIREIVPGNQNSVLPADYYILRNAPMTAVLVETGFISNTADRALLESEEGAALIADAVARGIAAALNPGGVRNDGNRSPDDVVGSLREDVKPASVKDPHAGVVAPPVGSDSHPCLGEPE